MRPLMPLRSQIDCSKEDWQTVLRSALSKGGEADLVNFDFEKHGEFCTRIAERFRIEFRLSREPGNGEAMIRNPWK